MIWGPLWDWTRLFIVGALIVFGMNSCFNSNWYKESERISAINEQKAKTPHVIREADGCKVYQFQADGKEHYFTRCPTTTSTDRNYDTQSGKQITHHTDTIVTTNGATQ